MTIQPDDPNVVQTGGALVYLQGLLDSQSKLVFAQPGGYVRMGHRIHVGIDPHRHRRHVAELTGDPVQHFQFRRGFQVKAMDAQLQRAGHLCRLFADPGKNNVGRVATGGDDAIQFTAGDDVETRTQPGQHIEHGQVGVRLHRVADQVIGASERLLILDKGGFQCRPRIDVTGCAMRGSNGADGDIFGIQAALTIRERSHGFTSCQGCCCGCLALWSASGVALGSDNTGGGGVSSGDMYSGPVCPHPERATTATASSRFEM